MIDIGNEACYNKLLYVIYRTDGFKKKVPSFVTLKPLYRTLIYNSNDSNLLTNQQYEFKLVAKLPGQSLDISATFKV